MFKVMKPPAVVQSWLAAEWTRWVSMLSRFHIVAGLAIGGTAVG
jgi:hypothetical protein